jgi:DNA-binding HxlR family transcriptional regulator
MKYVERALQSRRAKQAKKPTALSAGRQGRLAGTGVLESKEGCIASAMQIIGNKWTALILRDLAGGSKRFCELERSLAGISPRTLSQRLDALESCGIITKQSFAEVPPRTDYTLTAKGRDLIPVLKQMAAWGTKYHEATS